MTLKNMAYKQIMLTALLTSAPFVALFVNHVAGYRAHVDLDEVAQLDAAKFSADLHTHAQAAHQGQGGQDLATDAKRVRTRGPIPMDGNTPIGAECTDGALEDIKKWMKAEKTVTSFDGDKEMILRCTVQSYVFTTQQAAKLLNEMTWDTDKLTALKLFENRLTNPTEGNVFLEGDLAVFGNSNHGDEREAASELMKSAEFLKKAEARKIVEYPKNGPKGPEGDRAEQNVESFAKTLKKWPAPGGRGAFDEVLPLVKKEMKERPAPAFSQSQLQTVLKSFGSLELDEAVLLLGELNSFGAIYPMTCNEIVELLGMCDELDKSNGCSGVWKVQTEGKLEMLKVLKKVIKDPQNKALLVSIFQFEKAKAEEILRDIVVNFKEPVPPEEKIQEAIKKIGGCVNSYPWIKQAAGGYRCAGGGHFVSDDDIRAELDK